MKVLIYWLHLIGIVAWGGGIILHVLVVMPSLHALSPPDRGKLMGTYGLRFTVLSWGAVILVVVGDHACHH
jgi:uncharacterized membrane protein